MSEMLELYKVEFFTKREEVNEAIPRLQKALKANPEEVNLRAMLSNALQESGKLQESVRVLSNIQGEPNLNYWKQFANVCIAITEISDDEQWILKAETFVQNALEINLEDGSAHVAVGNSGTNLIDDIKVTDEKLHQSITNLSTELVRVVHRLNK